MSADLLSGLVLVMGSVNRAAHPDEVAASLVDGFRASLGAQSVAIFGLRAPHLVLIGMAGFPLEEVEGLQRLNLDDDLPIPRACAEGEPVIDDVTVLESRYARASFPSTRWRLTRDRIGQGSSVCVPIICEGRSVGAFALLCSRSSDWSTLELAALNGVANALGLWLTHPDSGMAPGRVDEESAPLTDRQVSVLALVAEDRSNTSIAVTLGVSESTVKQELRRVMRALNCEDRHTAVMRARELGMLDGRSR